MTIANGQISPGDLIRAHADLEGMSNCTQCHDLGKKVSSAKCLDCHKDIKSLVDENRGYHASSQVKKTDCFTCHSDHHGRKFQAIKLDEENFDHKLTGYELEGEHAVIDCRTCHIYENISDPKIKNRVNTFLGLEEECLSCHDDYHQKTLSDDCVQCHNFEKFDPATKFDHDDTAYKLIGKHVEVDCIKCHEKETRNGQDFQIFTDLKFDDCISCHDDVHNNRIKGACSQCHTEKSFSSFLGKKRFNHNKQTAFDLNGAHKRVDCFSCHEGEHAPEKVFGDRNGISENNCVSCHEDVHNEKFGNDCVKCHSENSFSELKTMEFFDHAVTDYPLEGNHVGVDCKKCHLKGFLEPIDFSACKNCHEDYHNSEFETENGTPDCVDCHSLTQEEGFAFSLFTLEQHQETSFVLEGAHLATPCFACHISEEDERWKFRNIGSECIDCHDDIHKEYIPSKYYPEQKCESCHVTDSWTSVDFDHDLTEWKLEGAHKEATCKSCHFEQNELENGFTQNFENLNNECIHCHENIHKDQFEQKGVTDCKRCHTPVSWEADNFDHSQTAFPLEGAHLDVACSACHEPIYNNGEKFVNYSIEKFECIDCHQ